MAKIRYFVPLIQQYDNAICWLVCAAMIRSYQGKSSSDISEYTGGFDPSSSSIPNPATSLPDLYDQLWELGFASICPSKKPTESYLLQLLRERGPVMLTHRIWGPGIAADATHTVVLTGIDTVKNRTYLNDPMQTAPAEAKTKDIINAIESLRPFGHKMISYASHTV